MSAGGPVPPADNSWVVAVHTSESDFEPRGAGVVIDDRRILTSAHLVQGADFDPGNVWVAFPMADDARRRVELIILPDANPQVKDLAVLVLADPVPDAVTPAPLRSPRSNDLSDRKWWAFGFPAGDPLGIPAVGSVRAALGYGWIHLDAEHGSRVDRGFSGGGLWSPDYQAVVAIVGQASSGGDGRAITLSQAIKCFPDQNLNLLSERFRATQSGELALTAWGWSLSDDPEGVRHWRPRARGVSIDSERGYRFRGRTAALQAIMSWLDRDATDPRVLVVTGAPGAGKSAVLGRVVTTADATAAAELPAWDTALRAVPGSVACAVHAKGKTALEIATEIARAASAALPERIEDFAPALRDALGDRDAEDGRDERRERGGRRFNVLIDALDEAAEARTAIAKVIVPIAETCADVGAQVVVGSRRRDDDGNLLTAFGMAGKILDLDDEQFFVQEDLAAYARATLQIERRGNPYAPDDIAIRVAARIAELSAGNFLVAGLTARTHGLYDDQPADPSALSFTATVDAAMREYLMRLPPVAGVSAETLLTALAFANDPGLPADLWQAAVRALDAGDVPAAQLARFARSSAANFLVESSGGDSKGAVFRLFHQALNDTLLRARTQVATLADDERALTRSFIAFGRETGWEHAPAYLLRSLPSHAARGRMIDDLLTDDVFVVHADLLRLLPLARRAESAAARQRVRLLLLAPRTVIGAGAPARAAQLSVTEALEDLGHTYSSGSVPSPYRAAWAAAVPTAEQQVLDCFPRQVWSVCAVTIDGRTQLAACGRDGIILIWDPATGTRRGAMRGRDILTSMCSFDLGGRTWLAVGAYGGTVQIADAATRIQHSVLRGHTRQVRAMCALTLEGRTLLATASDDRTVRIWDPATGTLHTVLNGHEGRVRSVCAFALDGRTLLATASDDRTVRIWDPATGTLDTALHGHPDGGTAVCAFSLHGRALLATIGSGGSIHIWDPATGTQQATIDGGGDWVTAMCAYVVDGNPQLATGSHDGTVRIWDPATGRRQATMRGSGDELSSICAFTLADSALLAVGDWDGAVRIWDPASRNEHPAQRDHPDEVAAISTFAVDGRTQLATCDDDGTVRIWDTAGTRLTVLGGHTSRGRALCSFILDGRPLLAVGGSDGAVRIWDPAARTKQAVFRGHSAPVLAVCSLTLDGHPLLITSSDDRTIRVWDPANGTARMAPQGVAKWDDVVCAFSLDGQPMLAAAGGDKTVRVWDPATAAERVALPTGTLAAACAFTIQGRTVLATSSFDNTIGIWDPATGTLVTLLQAHPGMAYTLCGFTIHGRTLLAAGGSGKTVQIWDPATASAVLEIATRENARALAYADGLLFVGTYGGLLAIRLDPDLLAR